MPAPKLPLALVLWTSGYLLAAAALAADAPPTKDDIPPARKMATQSEAVREARDVDLRLLARADKVQIAAAAFAGGKQVTLEKPADIQSLLAALRPRETPPSAGETAVTLTFLKRDTAGDRTIRTIWVYERGEWGFDRPGVRWTTGSDEKLWQAIRAHLK